MSLGRPNSRRGSKKARAVRFSRSPIALFNEHLRRKDLFRYLVCYKVVEDMLVSGIEDPQQLLDRYSNEEVIVVDLLERRPSIGDERRQNSESALLQFRESLHAVLIDQWHEFHRDLLVKESEAMEDLEPQRPQSSNRCSRGVKSHVNTPTLKLF